MTTTTTISNLPRDLLVEIVSRVPSKCMRKVRLTCKKWNTLSKSRSFSKMRLGKEASSARQGESPMVVLMDNDLHLVSFFVDRENPSTENKGKLNKVEISQVFHCEGLLLCILRNDTKVVVWNPFLGQTRRIETRYSYRGEKGMFKNMYVYAMGYVNNKKKSLRSYKILREEKLAVLLTHDLIYPYDFGVWITIKIGPEEVSWSKFLRLDTTTTPHYPISSPCFFVDEEKKVVMGFDEDREWKRHTLNIVGEAGYLRKLFLSGDRKKNIGQAHMCALMLQV
ncbi:unnamed protein product [Microthlaspi erraticum]|uniref:F-box domain-containing protein n=1 Tax=Microthlaspi erraticum TaxID=1685480 RepID=A0A6D2JV76_9BRAS|nr:unnamed protein product [Microthlaspi erraticum]